MTASQPVHPLDVDLADLVDGTVDADRAAALEAHLAGCLLCRIKRQRLRDAPPVTLDLDRAFPAPSFRVAVPEDAIADPAVDELWLAGAGDERDQRMFVLVLRTQGERVLVAPVTFDVEAADDETLIVGADHSPLHAGLAIYPTLATELPRSLLVQRLGAISTTGAGAGAPITGPSDPRIEIRQYLADRLDSMEEQRPDPATAADAPPAHPSQIRSSLIADLRDLRGDTCAVRPLDDWGDVLLAHHAGWTPLATVDEVGVVLVVLDTPHGLADDDDFNAGRAVLTRFNATALVVLASAVSELADAFDSPALNYGIEAPSGRRTPPRPLISGLSPFDAIAKFLDQTSGARVAASATRVPVTRVDVAAVLRETASTALADAARQASRFKIAPKRRGYESVAEAEDRFQAVLGQAFDVDPQSVAQALIDLAAEGAP
jgi:hypothetical protein